MKQDKFNVPLKTTEELHEKNMCVVHARVQRLAIGTAVFHTRSGGEESGTTYSYVPILAPLYRPSPLIGDTTLQYMMNAKFSQKRFI